MPEKRPIATPLISNASDDRPEENVPAEAPSQEDNADARPPQPQTRGERRRTILSALTLVLIVTGSAFVRFENNDPFASQSFWYDEVVSMRLAESRSLPELFERLNQIDATRAPLYPMSLRFWTGLFGRSEAAARSLSAVFGLGLVGVAFLIGGQVGGRDTALWSAFFVGFSPLLVEYSHEARMYSMLACFTAMAWWNLLRFRESERAGGLAVQVLLQTAMFYTHPLSLFMFAALGLGWWIDRPRSRLSPKAWIAIQAATSVLTLPWISRYLDHPPEFITGRLPVKFLAGVPIGFTGGDARSYVIFVAIIALGLSPRPIRGLSRYPKAQNAAPLLIWLIVPPTLLYVYSRVGHAIFGPARYNLYVAPAYLILLARGMATFGRVVALLLGFYLVQFFVSYSVLMALSVEPKKADWRGAAQSLAKHEPGDPVIVIPPGPGRNLEVEVPRYYLTDGRPVLPLSDDIEGQLEAAANLANEWVIYAAARTNDGVIGPVPSFLTRQRGRALELDRPGLRLYKVRARRVREGEIHP